MKTHRIQLTAEEQKKLEQVLRRLRQHDVQWYFLALLQKQWLKSCQVNSNFDIYRHLKLAS